MEAGNLGEGRFLDIPVIESVFSALALSSFSRNYKRKSLSIWDFFLS